MFDFNPQAQADQIRNAQTNPLTGADLAPGFFSGSMTAPFTGFARGVIAKPALLAGEAITPLIKPAAKTVDRILGTDIAGFLDDERRKNVELLKELTPDPARSGMAAQLVSGFFDILPTAIAGGGVTAGILEGFAQAKLAEDKGVDRNTANLFGAIQGLATGVGVALPMSLGLKTGSDLLYAAAANAVPNLAARGASGALLEQAGYKEMAQQYRALDAEAIAADVILGVAFAGAGRVIQSLAERVKPSDVDAALTVKARTHLEIDSAPGVPRDPVSRDLHVQAALKAADDLLAGRPVDVAGLVKDADFEPRPRGQVGSAFDEALAPYKAAADEAARTPVDEAAAVPARPADAAQAPAARPAEPTAAPAKAESPEVAAARQTLAELPELRVVDDDGNITTAADLMARADDAVTTARTESKAFDAAVNCLLRFGS